MIRYSLLVVTTIIRDLSLSLFCENFFKKLKFKRMLIPFSIKSSLLHPCEIVKMTINTFCTNKVTFK